MPERRLPKLNRRLTASRTSRMIAMVIQPRPRRAGAGPLAIITGGGCRRFPAPFLSGVGAFFGSHILLMGCNAPLMTERIEDFGEPVAPEHIRRSEHALCPEGDRFIVGRIRIRHIDHRAARRRSA